MFIQSLSSCGSYVEKCKWTPAIKFQWIFKVTCHWTTVILFYILYFIDCKGFCLLFFFLFFLLIWYIFIFILVKICSRCFSQSFLGMATSLQIIRNEQWRRYAFIFSKWWNDFCHLCARLADFQKFMKVLKNAWLILEVHKNLVFRF